MPKPQTHDPERLERRIMRLYDAAGRPTNHQGQERPKAWFAEQVGVHPNTVTKWTMDADHPDSRAPREPELRLLKMLEEQHGVD